MAVPHLSNGTGTTMATNGSSGFGSSALTTASSTAAAAYGVSSSSTIRASSDFDTQVQELSSPPAQSFTLVATLQLLDPFDTRSDVFLMTRSYLQNWLIWAYHQQVSKTETSRVDAALRLAAERYGLRPPQSVVSDEFAYADPGPIDVCFLSIEGHDLLLKPNVVVKEGEPHTRTTISTRPEQDRLDSEFPELLRRVKSLSTAEEGQHSATNSKGPDPAGGGGTGTNDASTAGTDDEEGNSNENHELLLDVDGENLLCCAVPERFYETLRSVIGVMCDDGFSVSMQPFPKETHALIHHHPYPPPADNIDNFDNDKNNNEDSFPFSAGKETINGGTSTSSDTNGHSNGGSYATVARTKRVRPRPIEFKRKIIMKQATPKQSYTNELEDVASPMTKLLKEQERLAPPRLVPTVETYPIKLNYRIVDPTTSLDGSSAKKGRSGSSAAGFVLVSRRTRVYDALHDLMVVAAPNTSSECKRVWSQRISGTTSSGDGFELVDLESLDGKLIKKGRTGQNGEVLSPQKQSQIPAMRVGEWIETHQIGDVKELEVIVELKRPNTTWPRDELELSNRIKVGDFVDAQDVTGKWFEAVVREVTDTAVKVHYLGWASKWDATLLRRHGCIDESANYRLNPPAPLWSHCRRWRQSLKEGSILEVRDSLSRADRPKWYKGIVRRVGGKDGAPKNVDGGAQLELFEVPQDKADGGDDDENDQESPPKKAPLFLMGRTQQILVEVEQERQNVPPETLLQIGSDESVSVDTTKPQPPFLRWVSLFGEEICEAGTHMKIQADGDLAVVTLRFEYEAGRKPVEIMKSFNGMYGQGIVKEAMRGMPPAPGAVGMHNLGNSCYLNSIIQCLNHIEPITEFFLKGDYVNDLNRNNPLGSGGMVATAYATLLKEVWSGDYAALAPRLLKQTVASFAPQFNNSYQHDSQEFCQFLMDGIHEDCNRVQSKPYVEELEGFGMEDGKAAMETWRKHLLRHDSIIVDRCQGMHRSHLTCPSCGRESIKFDVFSTISLPLLLGDKIGPMSTIRVEDCIDKFLEGEQLDDLNAWYCPSCKKHVCALKMIALWSVPDILILHLKRFQFENCSVSNNLLRSKIDDTVKFPIDGLDLRKHVLGPIDENAPPVYNLFGVSEHMGATANSGHYTATVRNSKDGRWYRYNDAHVGETTGDAAVNGGAYLLFYQRAKGRSKWAGMEKVMKDKNIDPYGGMETTDADGFTTVSKKK